MAMNPMSASSSSMAQQQAYSNTTPLNQSVQTQPTLPQFTPDFQPWDPVILSGLQSAEATVGQPLATMGVNNSPETIPALVDESKNANAWDQAIQTSPAGTTDPDQQWTVEKSLNTSQNERSFETSASNADGTSSYQASNDSQAFNGTDESWYSNTQSFSSVSMSSPQPVENESLDLTV